MRSSLPSLRHRRPETYRWPEDDRGDAVRGNHRRARHGGRTRPDGPSRRAADKRRAILDAAITVFARQGFHSARVSDVAAEAGVAYGLVYHYFDSKDQMLNELFSERWSLLVEASEEIRRGDASPRDKLAGVANFIIESYRHEPELMKVIIVEVTRAANSFGRTHLPEIRQAYDLVAEIVSDAQQTGEFRDGVDPNFAAMVFYGAIEQLLTGWIFELDPRDRRGLRARQAAGDRDHLRRPRAAAGQRRGGRLARTVCGKGSPGRERQDRVLHGAAKLANVLLGIIAAAALAVRPADRRPRAGLPQGSGAPRQEAAARPARARAHHGCPDGRSPRDSRSSCATPTSPSFVAASPTSPISLSPSIARAR